MESLTKHLNLNFSVEGSLQRFYFVYEAYGKSLRLVDINSISFTLELQKKTKFTLIIIVTF